jgi:TATA-box binding protein (TBP) (component of TFIID and TFIIIB)
MEKNINIIKIPLKLPQDLIKENNLIISYNSLDMIINNHNIYHDYISKLLSLEGLPSTLIISTISVTGKINSKIILENIDKYIILSQDNILSVKYSNKIRCLEKKINKSKKKNNRSFENQLTIEMRVIDDKKINIKIFKNGSFQMTGCKSLEDCNIVINKLLNKLKNTIGVLENGVIVDKPFIEDIQDKELNINTFKVDMINSNFSVNYKINRNALFEILRLENVNCRYEPCIHACVNIKYSIPNDIDNKVVSIFVFQSGNIIITGAKNKNQINSAYNYITSILTKYYNIIVKKDIISMLDNNDIKEILNELELYNNNINIIQNNIELEDNIIV